MSGAKHTPGPWSWDDLEHFKNGSSAFGLVCEADCAPREVLTVENGLISMTLADAALIAAAPDLLAACDMALAYVCNDAGSDSCCWCAEGHGPCTACVLRAAIAKAKRVRP